MARPDPLLFNDLFWPRSLPRSGEMRCVKLAVDRGLCGLKDIRVGNAQQALGECLLACLIEFMVLDPHVVRRRGFWSELGVGPRAMCVLRWR